MPQVFSYSGIGWSAILIILSASMSFESNMLLVTLFYVKINDRYGRLTPRYNLGSTPTWDSVSLPATNT